MNNKSSQFDINNRIVNANQFLRIIGSYGRKFLEYNKNFSYIERDVRGKIWLNLAVYHEYGVDVEVYRRIYISSDRYPWKGFNNGGTLRCLIRQLRDYIKTGKMLNRKFFGDYWAYGEDMQIVVQEGINLGVISEI